MTPLSTVPISAISVSVTATFSVRNWVQLLIDRTIVLFPRITVSCVLCIIFLMVSQNTRSKGTRTEKHESLGRLHCFSCRQLAVERQQERRRKCPLIGHTDNRPSLLSIVEDLAKFGHSYSSSPISAYSRLLCSRRSAPTVSCYAVADRGLVFWKG